MDLEILKTIGVHAVLSLVGLLIYTLIQVKDHLKNFSFKKFITQNKPFWIWALMLQFTFAVLIAIMPESSEAVKTLSGVDLSEPMAFLTSGAALGKLANWAVEKTVSTDSKIGNKPIV